MTGLLCIKSQLNLQRDYKVTMDDIDFRVYVGVCGGVPTKWIVQGDEWDFKVRFIPTTTGIVHMDSKNQAIQVYEKSEDEWHLF